VLGGLGAIVSILPLVYLVDKATTNGLDATWHEIAQRRTVDLVLRSLALTASVTLLCVLLGTAAAVLVTRTDVPLRRMWHVLLVLPLAIPSYLAAFAWISARPTLTGHRGATLVLTLVSFPYVYLPVVGALRRTDPALEEVARSLGRSRARALLVTVAQVRVSISAGGLLVALYTLSDFGAVATMRHEVFTWVIYGAYRAGFNPTRAAILALVLVVLATGIVIAEARARGRVIARVGGGSLRPAAPIHLGPLACAGALGSLTVLVGLAVGFPVGNLVYWLQSGVARDVDAGAVFDAFVATFGVSIIGALVTLALALPVGILAARFRSPVIAGIERATFVAHALPGIVIAISMVYVGVKLLEPVYLRAPLLVLAYAVLFLPLGVGGVRAAIELTPARLEDTARSLGRSPWGAWRDVTLRIAAPGVAASAALVLLTAMKELPVTLLLHPTGMETLSMAVWKHTGVSDYANAAPFAAVLMLTAAVPAALLSRVSSRDAMPR
jgi:iron(III) transport system permease protein